MSQGTLLLERVSRHETGDWFEMEAGHEFVPSRLRDFEETATREWLESNPVDELLATINGLNAEQRNAVTRVFLASIIDMGVDDEYRVLLTVSDRAHAEDWSSPEDDIYDSM